MEDVKLDALDVTLILIRTLCGIHIESDMYAVYQIFYFKKKMHLFVHICCKQCLYNELMLIIMR